MLSAFGRARGYLLGGFLDSLVEVLDSYNRKGSRC